MMIHCWSTAACALELEGIIHVRDHDDDDDDNDDDDLLGHS